MSIAKVIEQLVRDSEKNRLDMIDGTPIFGSPLVGFADGDDSLFRDYKKIIGGFHFEPHFKTRYSPRIASSWSERHGLFAAGLGTFGLSDGFITLRGMAMRCGSVVTNRELKSTPRKYDSHLENCPFFTTGKCGVCIDRCPVGAIDESGHDKARCRKFCNGAASDFVLENYGVKTQCCGLCQTGVPCESRIP